jgi:hypothetical protein
MNIYVWQIARDFYYVVIEILIEYKPWINVLQSNYEIIKMSEEKERRKMCTYTFFSSCL